MSITSGPSISGGSSASRLYSLADEGVLPLRVTVKSLKATLRPTVGLRVGLDTSMREILEKALAFNDRFQKPEHEILEILSRPVDIAVSNARTEGTDAAVRVQLDTRGMVAPKRRGRGAAIRGSRKNTKQLQGRPQLHLKRPHASPFAMNCTI